MLFDWHDEESDDCLRERGFDFDFASHLFEGAVEEFTDDRRDYGEARTIAFGHIDGRQTAVVYTQRDEVRWIIAAFRCRERELDQWKRRAEVG